MMASTDALAQNLASLSVDEPLPLRREFQRGQALYQKLEDSELSSNDAAFQVVWRVPAVLNDDDL